VLDPEVTAALVLILGMRGSLPQHVSVDRERVIIESTLGPMSDLDAAKYLSELPKPIACTAGLSGAFLKIHCGPPDEVHARMLAFQRTQASTRGGILGTVLPQQEGYDITDVLVRGGGLSRIVTAHAVHIFERDYIMVGEGVSMSVRIADEAEAQTGVRAVLSLGRVESLSREQFESMLRSIVEGT
jgi:hypothetical protein